MSIIVDLTKAIKAHITPLKLSDSHSTERVYIFELNNESIDGLMVHVLPTPPEIVPYSRSRDMWEIAINVAFTRRIEQSPQCQMLGQIDAAMDDVQTLMDSFRGETLLADSVRHRVSGITQASIYDDALLRGDGVFQSVFTIGFKAIR